MNRRRLLMLQQEQEGLPNGYTQLEYLQSTGIQWINTEYILQSSDTVEVKAEYVKKGSLKYTTAYLCGCDTGFEDGFNIAEDTATNPTGYGMRDVFGHGKTFSNLRPEVGAKFVVASSINLLKVVVDETITEISKRTQTYTPRKWPLYLFTTNRNKTAFDSAFIGKMYYAQITNSQGAITLNCIPCLDVNGAPCMFDTVSRKTLYNVGTDNFTWGVIKCTQN